MSQANAGNKAYDQLIQDHARLQDQLEDLKRLVAVQQKELEGKKDGGLPVGIPSLTSVMAGHLAAPPPLAPPM